MTKGYKIVMKCYLKGMKDKGTRRVRTFGNRIDTHLNLESVNESFFYFIF